MLLKIEPWDYPDVTILFQLSNAILLDDVIICGIGPRQTIRTVYDKQSLQVFGVFRVRLIIFFLPYNESMCTGYFITVSKSFGSNMTTKSPDFPDVTSTVQDVSVASIILASLLSDSRYAPATGALYSTTSYG